VESIERLIYELAMAALAEQERMLFTMRAGAFSLISVATVTGVLRIPPISVVGVVALAACVLSVACAVWVLLPHGLTFALRGADLLLADRRGRFPSLQTAYLLASRWAELQVQANGRAIAGITLTLSLGCFLLLVEILSLVLATAW
jgi:hypothetical protein